MRNRYKLKLTCLILLLLLGLSAHGQDYAYGGLAPSKAGHTNTVNLLLNDSLMSFPTSPFLLKGEVMVPAKAFFDSISAQVYWYENMNTIVAYKDNMFIKFIVGDSSYYLNGSRESMPIQAIYHKSEIFVPLKIISQAFDLNYNYNASENMASLQYRQEIFQYREIGYYHYKRAKLLDWGISFYIPEYWTAFENQYGSFGFVADYEHYEFHTRILPLDNGFSRVSLLENLQENLIYAHGDALSITGSKLLQVGDTYASALYYSILDAESNQNTHHILYVIYENNIGYVFNALYTDLNNNPLSREIFDTIISTFEINKISINNLYEHYMEFNSFYNHGITLTSPLYSNMQVENELILKGVLNPNTHVMGFYVRVSKGEENATFYVPVVEDAFDSVVYMPFGLGKHNVRIFVDEQMEEHLEESASIEDPDASDLEESPATFSLDDFIDFALKEEVNFDQSKPLLYFSVVNTSMESIKDLLPSEYVGFDTPEVYAQSSRLTFNLTSEHAKSRVIYDWIYNEFSLNTSFFEGDLKPLSQLILDKTGNPLEIPLLYAGLLRAVDIPARVVRGTSDDETSYWTEAYINGKWLIADIVQDISAKTPEYQIKGFNVTKSLHYGNFSDIEVLPF